MSNSTQLKINTTYRIYNQKNNFILDASTADNHTVACWNNITGPNQKWTMRDGNAFQNVYSKKFLAASNSTDDILVDAEDAPYHWNLASQDNNKTYIFYTSHDVINRSALQQVTNTKDNNYTVAIGSGIDDAHKWTFTPV